MRIFLVISYICLSLVSANAFAQGDDEAYANRFVDVVKRRNHGFVRISDKTREHIRNHPVLYIKAVEEKLGLWESDSLFHSPIYIGYLNRLRDILSTTESPASTALYERIFREAASRYKQLTQEITQEEKEGIVSYTKKNRHAHLGELMYYSTTEELCEVLLDEILVLLDSAGYGHKDRLFDCIRAHREVSPTVRKWLDEKGVSKQ